MNTHTHVHTHTHTHANECTHRLSLLLSCSLSLPLSLTHTLSLSLTHTYTHTHTHRMCSQQSNSDCNGTMLLDETHCTTLQDTARHCNAPQHTATHRNTLQQHTHRMCRNKATVTAMEQCYWKKDTKFCASSCSIRIFKNLSNGVCLTCKSSFKGCIQNVHTCILYSKCTCTHIHFLYSQCARIYLICNSSFTGCIQNVETYIFCIQNVDLTMQMCDRTCSM